LLLTFLKCKKKSNLANCGIQTEQNFGNFGIFDSENKLKILKNLKKKSNLDCECSNTGDDAGAKKNFGENSKRPD